ncbi:MAG: hypothetical protein HQL15_03870 [Candidatus Omnitrophica bacterium]|nr:hypothetical protein [Candidatus Omnitrophota bacterium]
MMYLIALCIAVGLGILTLRLILRTKQPSYLDLFLGAALGFGIVGQIIFYLQLLGNNFNHFLPPVFSLILLGILIVLNKSKKTTPLKFSKNLSLLILPLLAIVLWMEANYYPLGGWDAWSCWNLKAKFIYLGAEQWKDMLAPNLWRSNTNYPLALPTITVWFWHWTGFSQSSAMFNAVVLTLLTAGVLLLGLQEFKVSKKISILITVAVFTLALGNTLSISQYSDMLSSLFLLCAFICYLLSVEQKNDRWLILSAIFAGLLSFTKNEGLVASGLFALLVLYLKPQKPFQFISILLAAALPMVIFSLGMAPHNEAFINGLTSASKPSTLARLQYVLLYPLVEFIGLQWGGLWICAAAALIISGQRAIKKPLIILGLFIVGYLGIVLVYYQINTFFEIDWWMKNTLNRILFALMPTVFLWVGLSLKTND